jgi:hypothetical protein
MRVMIAADRRERRGPGQLAADGVATIVAKLGLGGSLRDHLPDGPGG